MSDIGPQVLHLAENTPNWDDVSDKNVACSQIIFHSQPDGSDLIGLLWLHASIVISGVIDYSMIPRSVTAM